MLIQLIQKQKNSKILGKSIYKFLFFFILDNSEFNSKKVDSVQKEYVD